MHSWACPLYIQHVAGEIDKTSSLTRMHTCQPAGWRRQTRSRIGKHNGWECGIVDLCIKAQQRRTTLFGGAGIDRVRGSTPKKPLPTAANTRRYRQYFWGKITNRAQAPAKDGCRKKHSACHHKPNFSLMAGSLITKHPSHALLTHSSSHSTALCLPPIAAVSLSSQYFQSHCLSPNPASSPCSQAKAKASHNPIKLSVKPAAPPLHLSSIA